MFRAKYIVIDKDGLEYPYVFNEIDTHANIARALIGTGTVVGAGFVTFGCDADGVRAVCWGESVSLRIASRPELDTKVLTRFLCAGL